MTPQAIRKYRLASGLSQSQAARLAGCHQTYWSHVELGRKPPSEAFLTRARIVFDLYPSPVTGITPYAELSDLRKAAHSMVDNLTDQDLRSVLAIMRGLV